MRKQQFDDDVRTLVRIAQERARTLGHPGIGCEHLLYAIAHSPTMAGVVAREHGVTPAGVAAQTERLLARPRSVFDLLDGDALATIGIDLQAVRNAVEVTFGPRTVSTPGIRRRSRRRVQLPGHLPVTGRARSCLEAAAREAGRNGAAHVAVHHLGAAVVAAEGGLVPPILTALGVSAPALCSAILERARPKP
jgi:ATP-dependent Clp protease ATP-binding subunit ClpA